MFARCETCGFVFPWGGFQIRDTNVKMVRTFVDCFRCGQPAQIMDGLYSYDKQGSITSIRGLSQRDAQTLIAILSAARRAPPKTAEDRAEVTAAVEAVDPKLAAVLRKANGAIPFIALMIALLGYLQQLRSDQQSDQQHKEMMAVMERTLSVAEAQQSTLHSILEEAADQDAALAEIESHLMHLLETAQQSLPTQTDAELAPEERLSKRRAQRLRGKEKAEQKKKPKSPPGD